MERTDRRLERLYVVTFALLATHEIDSAFWHEWDLFGLPGGIGFFLVANLALVLIFLHGLVRAAGGSRSGALYGLALSAAGTAAFVIHAWFLARGRPEFRSAASVSVLTATLLSSIALCWRATAVIRRNELP